MFGFITSIVEGDIESLKIKAFYIIIICTCVLISMIIDLFAGIRKARNKGEICTSYGLRRTVDKSIRYFSLLMLCILMDVISSLIIQMPYFTIISGLFLVGVEVLSWFEKGDKNDKKNAEIFISLLKNKEDITNAMAEAIKKTLEDKASKTD